MCFVSFFFFKLNPWILWRGWKIKKRNDVEFVSGGNDVVSSGPGQMSSSNVDARLLAIGFELEKLIGHMEVMVLVFDQQVTPAV